MLSSLVLFSLVGPAHAVDYSPIRGSKLRDVDGDGYVTVPSGTLAVPLFGGVPVDASLPTSMASAEGDTLVAWGAFRDLDDLGVSIDGLLWMMSMRDGEPFLLVAMDRGIEVGAETYGAYWLLSTAKKANPEVTSNPQDWLADNLDLLQRYHQVIVSDVPVNTSGGDGSEACTSQEYSIGTATLDFKGFSDPAEAWAWQNGGGAGEPLESWSWIITLAGCSCTKEQCRAGDPYAGGYCQTSCVTKENWCGTCSLTGTGTPPDCDWACDTDESCSDGGRGGVLAPAETQMP